MKYKKSLHIFRRDLRLEDNTSLNYALENSAEVMVCFIVDKRQVENNPYKSENAAEFMKNSLLELEAELEKRQAKLFWFYGISEEVVKEILVSESLNLVTVNKDYTPFALKRDKEIKHICLERGVDFAEHEDSLLYPMGSILKEDKKPYTIYTPFMKKSKLYEVRHPRKLLKTNFYSKSVASENRQVLRKFSYHNHEIALEGGRKEGLRLIKKLQKNKTYEEDRNIPCKDNTSKLSAHLKFGTISVRELYYAVDQDLTKTTYVNELLWRDFFSTIIYYFPRVLGTSFHKKYDNLKWSNNKNYLKAWEDGKTGFPIVDAGMRELNITGFMHNRVRMIVASFLVKDLHIDWRLGEQYFAQNLVDYDPALNNGNWQWAASTGCDAQPYFRIFNPWRQQERFDADCAYIKKWVPELKSISSKEIHKLYIKHQLKNYPKPIVNHQEQAKQAKEMYTHFKYNKF